MYRVDTGLKRVAVNVDGIPEETVLETGYMSAPGEMIGYYGPGSQSAEMTEPVPWDANVTVSGCHQSASVRFGHP